VRARRPSTSDSGPTGKRQRPWVSGKTKTEAKQKLLALRRDQSDAPMRGHGTRPIERRRAHPRRSVSRHGSRHMPPPRRTAARRRTRAARARHLGITELAWRIDERFELLTGGPRTVVARQRTLRAAMVWLRGSTASAAGSVNPPSKTARRAKRSRSASLRRAQLHRNARGGRQFGGQVTPRRFACRRRRDALSTARDPERVRSGPAQAHSSDGLGTAGPSSVLRGVHGSSRGRSHLKRVPRLAAPGKA
jgi:hypothetical protein